jgi:hypothetical protein
MPHRSQKPERSQAPPPQRLRAGWALSREDFMHLMMSLKPHLKDNYPDKPDYRFSTCLHTWFVLPPVFKDIHREQLFFTTC